MTESASWVIVDRATGKAVFETFSKRIATAINLERYDVVPILQYLQDINRQIREGRIRQ